MSMAHNHILYGPSSPIREGSTTHHAEHLRQDVADYSLPEVENVFVSTDAYYNFLNDGPQKRSDFYDITARWPTIQDSASFIHCANVMSHHISENESEPSRSTRPTTGHNAEKRILEFRKTENFVQVKHVTDTQVKPDFIAAFKTDWSINNFEVVKAWGMIQLVGEIASAGKTKEMQNSQAASYLHYLVLARPDLYIAHGMLVDKEGVTFLAGIAGQGISRTKLRFNDAELLPLLYALICHIYNPGEFKDLHYEVEFKSNAQECLYTLSVNREADNRQPLKISGLQLMYAGSPFGSCTYFFAPHPRFGVPLIVDSKEVCVIKDQYCGRRRFNEPEILKHIHAEGFVPGVIRLTHDEEWAPPETYGRKAGRVKRRLGFDQYGAPFMGIATVQGMLEVAFDLLEVTRYLRAKRRVLHRDIGSRNVMVNLDPETSDTQGEVNSSASPQGSTDSVVAQEHDMCFIKHLLGQSPNPRHTNLILIDFNRSEQLDTKEDPATYGRHDRTGTPLFVARAVHHGKPYPTIDPRGIEQMVFPPISDAHSSYGRNHPQRIELFGEVGDKKDILVLNASKVSNVSSRPWRHELYHEAESVYWLVTLWLMYANPTQPRREEEIPTATWTLIQGPPNNRHSAILSLIHSERIPSSFIHSTFKPVETLLAELSGIISPCPHFLDDTDIRAHPEYVHEAMQRAILNFLVANCAKTFLTVAIESQPRQTPKSVAHVPLSQTRAQEFLTKRPSPTVTGSDDSATKRTRREYEYPSRANSSNLSTGADIK